MTTINFFPGQDRLYFDFLEAWQSHSSEQEIFDIILEFVQSCSSTLDLVKNSDERALAKLTLNEDKKLSEIESERNTWRLIYALYQVRQI